MWNRKSIKANGKLRFQANYWRAVVVALLLTILTASATVSGSSQQANQQQMDAIDTTVSNMSNQEALIFFSVLTGTVLVIILIGIALGILVFNPLQVGCRKFFLTNLNEKALVGQVGYAFSGGHYKNAVVTMFMTDLKIALWSLLFIIPGIIKSYSYRMVPYILCENPEMNWKDAQVISRNMMNGNKWDAFVYDLSFIGWYILTGLTMGLVGVFYAGPYKASSDAVLYTAIKGEQFIAQPQM